MSIAETPPGLIVHRPLRDVGSRIRYAGRFLAAHATRLVAVTICAELAALAAFRGMLLFTKPFWLDEVFSAAEASATSLNELFRVWILNDVHPPLYPILLHAVAIPLGSSDIALRLPSLVFGCAAVAVVFFGLRDIWGHPRAGLAAVILAASPNAVFYSAEARSYALVLLTSAVATVFAVRFEASVRRRDLIGFTVAAIILAMTHYFGLVLAAALYPWLLCRRRREAGRILISGIVCLATIAPWLAYHLPFLLSKSGGHFWIPQTTLLQSIGVALEAVFGEQDGHAAVQAELVTPLIAMIVLRRAKDAGVTHGLSLLAFVLAAVAILLVVSRFTPLVVARYFLVFTPVAAVASVAVIGSLGRRALLVFAAALPLLVTAPWAIAYVRTNGEDTIAWDQTARAVTADPPKALIFLLDDPLAAHCTPVQLEAIGAFLFRRNGLDVPIVALDAQAPDAPARLAEAAAALPRPFVVVKPTARFRLYTDLVRFADAHHGRCMSIDGTPTCRVPVGPQSR